VGVTGHVKVGDRTMVAAKSAVLGEVDGGRQVAGIPAVELAAWRRQVAALARLDRLQRRVRRLEAAAGAAAGGVDADDGRGSE
jgi:UDP-3-O-[3-hydroxymyristoyl] glucosamine N-acyltransferase